MEVLYFIVIWTLFAVSQCLCDPRLGQSGSIQYSLEFLINLRDNHHHQPQTHLDIPAEVRSTADIFHRSREFINLNRDKKKFKTGTRKRGRRGGVRQRLKRLKLQCIPLPSILLCNAQSIRNKVDELQANVIHLEKFRDTCIIAFNETWLTSTDLEIDLSLSGFGLPIRLDRDADVTGKSLGGGVCLYVNERWCRNITVRETVCTPDIELLSVFVRPFYLPREFPQIF